MTEIRVPGLGESVTEATVGNWLKKAGDAVAVDEPLVELETDKVTIEVPAPPAGILADILAKHGDTIAVGGLLGQIMTVRPLPLQPNPLPSPPGRCSRRRRACRRAETCVVPMRRWRRPRERFRRKKHRCRQPSRRPATMVA